MVVVIGLKKMIITIVFWDIQIVFIDEIINFCIHRRFKTRNKR